MATIALERRNRLNWPVVQALAKFRQSGGHETCRPVAVELSGVSASRTVPTIGYKVMTAKTHRMKNVTIRSRAVVMSRAPPRAW